MPEESSSGRWEGKPVLAFIVRATAFTTPIVLSVIVSIWLSGVLPEPQSLLELGRWWAVVLGASTVVLFGANKAARRFLPLAALMRMTMVFPDKAPGRFKTALRSGSSVKHLKSRLDEAERVGRHNDVDEAAEFILKLSNALNTHDRRTRGHAERVRAYAEMLAEELDLSEKDRSKLRWASLLHDIGKLKISGEILNKPGALDDDEWEEIKKHPSYGADICAPLLEWLGPFAATIEDHHERFDGRGYPNGKKGEEISLGGRIVCVADAYDVMTTVRSYKPALPTAVAREELARNAGGQFDPDVVRAFLNISMGRLRWIAGPLSWLAQLPFLRFVGAVQQVGTAVGVAGVAATGVAAVVGSGVVDLPGNETLDLLPAPDSVQASGLPATSTIPLGAIDDVLFASEDSPAALDLLANDGLTGVLSIVVEPEFGTVVLNADGTVTYIPDPDYSGNDTFTYAVTTADGATETATVSVTVDPVNDLPTVGDDIATVEEDNLTSVVVLANDLDQEGLDPTTLRIVAPPVNGSAVVDPATFAIVYTPNPDFAGRDAFTYQVADTAGEVATGTVTIDVVPVNDPPEARDDSAATVEDSAITFDVLGNDSDLDDELDGLGLETISGPISGTAVVSGTGFTYTPAADFSGTDSFTYRICDDEGACAEAVVTISVSPVNDPPSVPGPGPVSATEDGDVVIDLLAGASDPDGDELIVTVARATIAAGTVTDNGDGTVTYAPAPDYSGPDTFTYEVADGSGGVVAGAVAVSVAEVNDPPVVPGPGPLVTAEDTMVSFDPLAGATDVDGDAVALDSFDAVSTEGGVVALGSLEYTPPANFTGDDSFTYVASDGRGGTTTVTVAVTVTPANDAPVAGDDVYVTVEDTALVVAAPGVAGNDTDLDGDLLTVAIAAAPADGTVALAADGSFTYTPDPDWNGADSFLYKVADGNGGTATATVTITVTADNDPPGAGDDSYAVTEDTPLSVPVPGVVGNDGDADGDALSVSVVTPPGHGTLTLGGDGSFDYVPAPDFAGSDSFIYEVADGNGGTDTATATLTVAPVPDAPVAGDDPYTTGEDSALVVVAPGVLGNDGDADGDALVASMVTPPGNGSLILAADGSFTYSPDPDWNGADSFLYEVADGTGGTATATATITVTADNDPPVAGDDSYVTNRGVGFSAPAPGVMSNDTDVDLDIVSAALLAGPTSGGATSLVLNADGSFTYTPDPAFVGVDEFTYEVSDGVAASNPATVSITVDSGTAALTYYLGSGVHAADTSLFSPVAPPAIPLPDYDGDADPGRTIGKSGGKENEADPEKYHQWALVAGADSLELQGPAELRLWSTAASFDDHDVHPHWYLHDCTGAGTGCTLLLEGDLHVDDWNGGAATWVYRTIDLGHLDATIAPGRILRLKLLFGHRDVWVAYDTAAYPSEVAFTLANGSPVAVDDAAATNEEAAVAISVTANDVDANLDPDTISVVSGPADGSAIPRVDGSGIVDYTPNANFAGTDTFDYIVCDTSAACAATPATVTVTVSNVNDPPVLDPVGAQSGDEGTLITFTATGSDPLDTPADDLSFSLSGAPAGAAINPATGVFSWTPTEAQGPGVYSFQVVVTDDGTPNLTDSETISVTVTEVNQAPEATAPLDQSSIEGETVSLFVAAADPDVPPNTLSWSAAGLPPGLAINSGTGEISGTVTAGAQAGSPYTVTVTVDETDGVPANLSDSVGFDWAIGPPSSAGVVITELRTVGPGGALDEFVEIYNATAAPVSIEGWTLKIDDGDLTHVADVTIDSGNDGPATTAVLAPYGFYLMVGSGYSGGVAGDQTFAVDLVKGAGVEMRDGIIVVDAVGTSELWKDGAGSLYREGDPLAPMQGNFDHSYERRNGDGYGGCVDTDNNASDFFHNFQASTPRNSSGAAQPCATPPPYVPPAPATHVVISEFRFDGPNGDTDEFVELFNPSGVTIDLNGYELRSQDPAETLIYEFTAPVLLGPGEHYLLAGDKDGADRFSTPGGIAPDAWYPAGIENGDGPFLEDGLGNVVDAVALRADAAHLEGAPLPPVSGRVYQSYERLQGGALGNCVDTDDNPADFFHNISTENPQNSSSAATPCAGANYPPVLDPVGDRSTDEQVLLIFAASATDPNVGDSLVFSLSGAPAGATIDPDTGDFTWTPTEAQDGAHSFDVVVTDDGAPNLADSETITVTVDETPQPPVLAPISDPQAAVADALYTLNISASDPDLPADTLTISAVGVPAWAAFTDNGDGTAEISGTPSAGDVGSTWSITVTVSDGALSDDQTFDLGVYSEYAPSPWATKIVINEILITQGNGSKEFFEIYNASAGSIDLTGWTLADWNMIEPDDDGVDSISGEPKYFSWVFPAGSVLPADGYAVVWTGDWHEDRQAAPTVSLQFWISVNNMLKAKGDDAWLYDTSGLLVDYVPWGKNGDENIPPSPLSAWWDDTNQDNLGNPPGGTSISLTPNGVDSNDSDCWELTTSDSSACGAITVDNWGSTPHLSSPGGDNNVAYGDLGVSASVDAALPNPDDVVTYTVTVSNNTTNLTTGVEVTDLLPAGVAYVGDDSLGAYDPVTGVWDVGILDESWSLSLNIDARVTAARGTSVDNTATITAADRIDLEPGNDSDTATITVNSLPIAGDDAVSAVESQQAVFSVLDNDSDPDLETLSISAWDAAGTQGGVVDCSSGTTCSYWALGFASPPDDTFTYTVTDGAGNFDTATVTVTIAPEAGTALFLTTDGSTAKNRLLPLAPGAHTPFAVGPSVPDVNDGADGKPGRKVERVGGDGIDETDDKKYQTWAFPAGAGGLTLGGNQSLVLHAAIKDFDTNKRGEILARLSHCAPAEGNDSNGCLHLGVVAQTLNDPWDPGGGWREVVLDFGPVGPLTIPAGDELRVKVVTGDASEEHMYLAYDTAHTPTRLRLL